MAEEVPASSTISLENWLGSAELSDFSTTDSPNMVRNGDEAVGFSAAAVISQSRSDRWRSKTMSGTDTASWDFDMGTDRDPKEFAILDANFLTTAGSATLTLKGSNSPDFASGSDVIWTVDIYTATMKNKVNFWHLGTPDSNDLAYTQRRYWRITTSAFNTYTIDDSNDYLEIGTFWIGDRTEILVDPGIQFTGKALANVGVAAFGNANILTYGVGNDIKINIGPMAIDTILTLKNTIQQKAKVTSQVLFDVYAHLNDTARRPHAVYYGKLSRTQVSYITSDHAIISFTLDESLG